MSFHRHRNLAKKHSWNETTLGEIVTLQRGFDLPFDRRSCGHFPVIASNGQVGMHSEAMVKGPGVVIGRSGFLGGGQYIESDFWPLNTTLWVKDFHGNDVRYCYYLLRSLDLGKFNAGSGVPTLNRNHIHPLPARIPPIAEQRTIAHILGTLDDKIELNRRMNETLEAMAKTIFKDWFIDFGPVRAKMEGREPYLPSELWSLFPNAIGDKEKPVGWETKPLDEIADFMNGLALQKFPITEDDNESLPVVKIAELRGGVTARSGRASRLVPSNYVIENGDFLFSWSGSLLAKFWTGGEAALNQHLFKVTSDRFPAWFFSQCVYHHLKEFQTIAATKATTMGHIKREHLKQAVVTCPPDNVIATLGRTVEPLITRTIKNSIERSTLSNIRDLLLPKLVSGETEVKDAETIVEDVL